MTGIKKCLAESPAARAAIASVTRGYPAVMVSNFSASHGAFRGQLQWEYRCLLDRMEGKLQS